MNKDACRGLLPVVACLLLLLLSGCIAPGSQPRVSRAASLRRRILLPEMGRFEEGVERETFQKAVMPDRPITLDEAVQIALANNRSLKVSAEDVLVAIQNARIARSAFFPQAGVMYGYDRRSEPPGMKVPASTLLPPGPGVPETLSIVAGEKEFQRAELKVQMTLWDFGRTLGTYRQATLRHQIASLMLERARQQVRLQVAEAYFNILRARRARAIAEESLGQAEAHLKTAVRFEEQGLVDRNDVLQAELRVAEVRQSLIKAAHAVELATSVFNSVLGINVNRKTEVVDVTEALPTAVELREALELAVGNRPEFQVIQKIIAVEERGLTVAKAAFLPRIYVAGGYNRLDDDFQLHKDYWAGELGIQFDLFTGGRRLAETRIARSEIRRAEEKARDTCDAIALQVKSAVLDVADARGRLAVAEKAVAQADENLRLMNNKYRQNVASSTDVIDAEVALARARTNYYGAVYDCNTARARLESAIGRRLAELTGPPESADRFSEGGPQQDNQAGGEP